MSRRMIPTGRSLAAAFLTATVLVACGGGGDGDSASDDCNVVSPDSDGNTTIEIIARDMDYVDTCYEIEPGDLTIDFTSDDGDTAHNVRVEGNGINEATEIIADDSETLELDMSATGTYDFRCDPHPNMTGEIRVVEASSLPG